jgi:RHH-type proline utilization regulon transcriptional repressor/proline dehydrogenase/delta 1-pyrroline-5-carboxylate dehydrogenase
MSASLNQPSRGDTLESLRAAIRDQGTWPEERAVSSLLHALELTGGARHRAVTLAMSLVSGARGRRDERPFLDAFLQEFGLSNQEGIALMCIAEALLRIPDDATADRLIAEKLATGDWSSHAGRSESLFVNASTWGLMLTGGILDLDPAIKSDAGGWLRTMTRKAGEPLVRLAVRRAMKIIGGEFVVGRSIEEALARSAREPDVGLCSFDMLGEGARTSEDAERYLKSYQHAIQVIGAAAPGAAAPGAAAPGVSAPGVSAPGVSAPGASALAA